MKHSNVAIFVPHLGCPHDCSFCNQKSIVGQATAPTPQDVKAILENALPQSQQNESEIAFFGGSFTAIDWSYVGSLLEETRQFIGAFKGIRISTRPDAIDEKILDALSDYHITTIELGAQSMDDQVLHLNNRGHTVADVKNASALIQSKGIQLGLQMMVGLYGDSPEGALETARQIAALKPDMVRIYPTLVIEKTKLEELYRDGIYQPMSLEQALELCKELLLFFEGQGIPVIRLGLHASEGLEAGLVAGPWHPAFRELVESKIYLEKAVKVISQLEVNQMKSTIAVSPNALSKMIGQHGLNLKALQDRFGIDFKVVGDKDLDKYEIVVK